MGKKYKPYIPEITSPFALWWSVRHSLDLKDSEIAQLPLYRFIATLLDHEATISNTRQRPLIKTPKDLDLSTIKTKATLNFIAKKRVLKIFDSLPVGLNS